jgi:hypothetical protein
MRALSNGQWLMRCEGTRSHEKLQHVQNSMLSHLGQQGELSYTAALCNKVDTFKCLTIKLRASSMTFFTHNEFVL